MFEMCFKRFKIKYLPRTHKICDIKNFDFVDQNLSKFDDFGVFGKLGLRSIQIDD